MTISAPARCWRLAAACAALLLPLAAQAQYVMEFWETYAAPTSNFINLSALNNTAMINAATPKGSRASKPGQPLLAAENAQVAHNAHTLAQRMPAARRKEMEKIYADSFDIYRKLEAKFGWQAGDVAGALAAFVVGNYMAYSLANVPDDHFVAVARQFRGNADIAKAFGRLKPQELRTMYEQVAMVGTFMALTQMSTRQQVHPPEQLANVRAAAAANLKQVLGVDPARLQLGPDGMRIR